MLLIFLFLEPFLFVINSKAFVMCDNIDRLFPWRNGDYSFGSFFYQFRSKYHIITIILVKSLLLHTKIHVRPAISYLTYCGTSLDIESLTKEEN